jgi:hypothetical protein
MEALIIGPDEIAALQKIKKTAEEHPYSLAQVIEACLNKKLIRHKGVEHTCMLPRDFKVVLTVEEQKHPIGMTWHLSVSRPSPHHPSPGAVEMIIEAMELKVRLESALRIFFEDEVGDFVGNYTTAINLIFAKNPIHEP